MQIGAVQQNPPPTTNKGPAAGGPNDPAVQKFLFESEVSQIFSSVQSFGQNLPNAVGGGQLVGQLLSQALQGPPDPTDPGAHVLDPSDG